MESALEFAHLVAVAAWVVGMFFAHLCLRPAGHAMAAICAAMTVIFLVIAHGLFPRVKRAAAGSLPDAAGGFGRIRTLVAVNLGLGLATIAVATLGR